MMTSRILKIQKQVCSLYKDELKSVDEISEIFHINKKTTRRILKCNDIEIRGSKKNLLGNRFGRLEVIKYVGNDLNQKAMWECWCNCGNKCKARTSDLLSGKIISCGCNKSERSRENIKKALLKYPHSYGFTGIGEIPGGYISQIKHGAFIRGFEYDITKEYLWELYLKQNKKCALTGLEIYFGKWGGGKRWGKRDQTASLDRIDSKKGYIEGNVHWVHKDINNIKQDYSLTEFINYCKLIIDYDKQKYIKQN